jgi:hypothetical protein
MHRPKGTAAVAAACLIAAGLAAGTAHAQDKDKGKGATKETRVTLKDQTDLAVTIYNNNFALVRDSRMLTLVKGINRLALEDVSGKLRAETAIIKPLGGTRFTLLEQNFDYDLLTPRKLLEKSVGKEITVLRYNPKTKEYTPQRALVLSTSGGTVLKIGDQIYTGAPGRIVFDKVPKNLRARPTLVVTLDSKAAGRSPVALTYLTGGMRWKADYVATLNKDDSRLDINGWVTLNNTSGTTYKNARLQLVAGDVRRVQRRRLATGKSRYPASAEKRAADRVSRSAVFDYYVYKVNGRTTIRNRQQKQIAFMAAAYVPVTKEYRFYSGRSYGFNRRLPGKQTGRAQIWLVLRNDKKSNLGYPLPKGVMRVYKKGTGGEAVFVGEDRINHTPDGNEVNLRVGSAFDITGERVQTNYTLLSRYPRVYESSYKIKLKNAKKEAVTVFVMETIPGQWEITRTSDPHRKVDVSRAEWKITIPAKGSKEIRFTVRVKY